MTGTYATDNSHPFSCSQISDQPRCQYCTRSVV